MLREGFANPVILAILGTNDDDKTVSCSIVGMEEIGDDFEETKATSKNDKEILGAEEIVEILLKLLRLWSALSSVVEYRWTYQRQRQLHRRLGAAARWHVLLHDVGLIAPGTERNHG